MDRVIAYQHSIDAFDQRRVSESCFHYSYGSADWVLHGRLFHSRLIFYVLHCLCRVTLECTVSTEIKQPAYYLSYACAKSGNNCCQQHLFQSSSYSRPTFYISFLLIQSTSSLARAHLQSASLISNVLNWRERWRLTPSAKELYYILLVTFILTYPLPYRYQCYIRFLASIRDCICGYRLRCFMADLVLLVSFTILYHVSKSIPYTLQTASEWLPTALLSTSHSPPLTLLSVMKINCVTELYLHQPRFEYLLSS